MAAAEDSSSKSDTAQLLGMRLSRATEHIIWILLSVWFFLEVIPRLASEEHWRGPVSWFSSLWVDAGLPGTPLTDLETGVWSTFDSVWAVWLFILLSAGTCGLAVGHPEKWGLRALSYLGVAGAVESAGAFWPVAAALAALLVVATIAGIQCWWKDRYPEADNYMDYATPGIVFIRFLRDVVLHYFLPVLGPLILLLFALQNFSASPQPHPAEELLRGALTELHTTSDSPMSRKDLVAALEVIISLNGASRQEMSSFAASASAVRRTPRGAMIKRDIK